MNGLFHHDKFYFSFNHLKGIRIVVTSHVGMSKVKPKKEEDEASK